jgi:hypothetical protein
MSTPTTSPGGSAAPEPSHGQAPGATPEQASVESPEPTAEETHTPEATTEQASVESPEPTAEETHTPEATTEQASRAPAAGGRRMEPVAALLLLAIVVGLVLTAFVLPAIKSAPRGVPIGVAGPTEVATAVSKALEQRSPGAFAVTGYSDEAALTAAVRNREVYGGIAVGPSGPTMLTAPAGSPAVSQVLTGLAIGLSQQSGQQVPINEVVPLPEGDPRGAAVASAVLPLIIGSIVPVLAMIRLVRSPWRRLAGVLAAAVLLGATIAGLLHWFGAFSGSWARDAAAFATAIAAMSTALLGLYTVGRWVGFGAGAATFVILGNPLSGIATAPEFLPTFWSTLGSWLPPGAAGQVVRSSAYFEGAGAAHGLLVLATWFVFGLVLIAVGSRRQTEPVAAPA